MSDKLNGDLIHLTIKWLRLGCPDEDELIPHGYSYLPGFADYMDDPCGGADERWAHYLEKLCPTKQS